VQADPEVLQMRLQLGELARFVALDEAVRHEIAPPPAKARSHTGGPRDPLDHLQVAQPAGRLLQVRLERVGRILVLGVALLLLQLFCFEEGYRVGDFLEFAFHPTEKRPTANEEARLEKRGADGDVARCRFDAALDGAHAVADLQADVPEPADQALERLTLGCGRLLRQEHQEIDVRARVELAPAVAAGGDERRVARDAGLAPHRLDRAVDEARVAGEERARVGPAQVRVAQRLACDRHLAAQIEFHRTSSTAGAGWVPVDLVSTS
jgi:hypothetical protein